MEDFIPYALTQQFRRDFQRLVCAFENLTDTTWKGFTEMGLDFTVIRNAVTAEETIDAGLTTFMAHLSQQIADLAKNQANPADQQALDAIAQEIVANTQTVKDAIVANTPAGPVVPPPDPGTTNPGTVTGEAPGQTTGSSLGEGGTPPTP